MIQSLRCSTWPPKHLAQCAMLCHAEDDFPGNWLAEHVVYRNLWGFCLLKVRPWPAAIPPAPLGGPAFAHHLTRTPQRACLLSPDALSPAPPTACIPSLMHHHASWPCRRSCCTLTSMLHTMPWLAWPRQTFGRSSLVWVSACPPAHRWPQSAHVQGGTAGSCLRLGPTASLARGPVGWTRRQAWLRRVRSRSLQAKALAPHRQWQRHSALPRGL